jgi:hypothetical protein
VHQLKKKKKRMHWSSTRGIKGITTKTSSSRNMYAILLSHFSETNSV